MKIVRHYPNLRPPVLFGLLGIEVDHKQWGMYSKSVFEFIVCYRKPYFKDEYDYE